MIQSYSKYKQFHASVLAKDNEKAVRQGLDFLRFVAEEYIRLEVYNHQECDGDDFFTYQVEKELAEVLRDETTPLDVVAISWTTSRECTLVVRFPRNSSWSL